jgi:hypothetical protein
MLCRAQNEPTKRMLATETKFITGMRKGKHVKIDNNYCYSILNPTCWKWCIPVLNRV